MIYRISDIWAGQPKPAIGLELELESPKPQNVDWIKGSLWTVHNDGSLRKNGVEYVFVKPLWNGDIVAALEQFQDNTKGTKFLEDSINGSTHVHYNVGHLCATEVVSILVAWSILEDIFLGLCKPTRRGNLFALRYCDSNGFISTMLDGIRGRDDSESLVSLFRMFNSDRWKYMNLNVSTIRTLGTIEFRCYHSTADVDEISSWINRLINFCERAVALGNPIDVLNFADTKLPVFIEQLTGIRPTDEMVDACRNNMSTAFRMAYVVPKWEDLVEFRKNKKQEPKKQKKSSSTPEEQPPMFISATGASTTRVFEEAITWVSRMNNAPTGGTRDVIVDDTAIDALIDFSTRNS